MTIPFCERHQPFLSLSLADFLGHLKSNFLFRSVNLTNHSIVSSLNADVAVFCETEQYQSCSVIINDNCGSPITNNPIFLWKYQCPVLQLVDKQISSPFRLFSLFYPMNKTKPIYPTWLVDFHFSYFKTAYREISKSFLVL